MKLVERTKNIIKAKVDQVNQSLANPEADLEDALESMRVLKIDLERSAAGALTEIKLINRQIEIMEGEQAGWLEKAEKAVGAGQDDLARRALIQKQALKNEIKNCQELLFKTEQNYKMFINELTVCQEKYSQFSTKLNLLKHNKIMNKAGIGGGSKSNENEELEIQFEQLKAKNSSTIDVETEFQNLKNKLKKSN